MNTSIGKMFDNIYYSEGNKTFMTKHLLNDVSLSKLRYRKKKFMNNSFNVKIFFFCFALFVFKDQRCKVSSACTIDFRIS